MATATEPKILKPKEPPFPPTEKQLEKAIKQNYRAAWEETRAHIAEIYERYATGETLTRTDMVKYNRLNKTEQQLAGILSNLYKRNRNFLYQSMEAAFLAGYFEQIFELEMQSDILLGFGGVTEQAFINLLSESLTGLTLNERLKKNEREVVAQTRQALAQALAQGESYQQAARRFLHVYEGDTAKAVRIAWTETHRAQESAALDVRERARERLKFDEIWLATLDGRTRDTHRKMDQKKKQDDGYFHIGRLKGRFPGDPMLPAREVVHCRCTVVTRFPDRPMGERRGRKSLDESTLQNNERFPANMRYEQWYRSRIANNQ